LAFTLTTAGTAGLFKGGDVVFQYVQFRLKTESTNWNTVVCATTVGASGEPNVSQITSFEGATDFDSTSQTGKSIATMLTEESANIKDRTTGGIFFREEFNTKFIKAVADPTAEVTC